MHVILGHVGDLVVDDVRQVVDVDATCGDVGGHQGADLAGLEAFQRLSAGALALVAVQRHGRHAVLGQVVGHVVGAELGAREDQYLAPVVLLDDVQQHLLLLGAAHRVDDLADALHRGVARRDLDALWVFQQAAGQLADLVAEGGRKQQALLGGGQQRQHLLHIMDEAHIQHAVGLVQHQHLNGGQVQEALLLQVQQAAGSGHQNVHPALQALDLRIHAHAAEDHRGLDVQMLAIGAHGFLDLGGQFACRGEHQGAHAAAAEAAGGGAAGLQALQHWQREGGRLAGAGLRAGQQVVACQHGGDGLGLDGSRAVVALFLHGTQNGRRELQFVKCHRCWMRPSWALGIGPSPARCCRTSTKGTDDCKSGSPEGDASFVPSLTAAARVTGARGGRHCRMRR